MCLNPIFLRRSWIYVPCGKCVECKMQKARDWAMRIMLEASCYEYNCFITLTYNDANLPDGQALSLRDLQLFVKRLRKAVAPLKIRTFYCGEYGSLKGRPHYHLIIFNYDFPDKYFFCYDKKGEPLFRSPQLEKLWTFGFSSVCELSYESAKYCAKYIQKSEFEKKGRSFVGMSRRPAIGSFAMDKNLLDSDKIYYNGKYIKLPRFFLDNLEKVYPDKVKNLKAKRLKRAKQKTYECIEFYEDFENDILVKRKKFEKIFGVTLDKFGRI